MSLAGNVSASIRQHVATRDDGDIGSIEATTAPHRHPLRLWRAADDARALGTTRPASPPQDAPGASARPPPSGASSPGPGEPPPRPALAATTLGGPLRSGPRGPL